MNSPYSIFPIGILSLILYLFTYVLARIGTISISFHRQIWNILLLCTFFTTATLGLILAIQVNYKLKLGITDQLMVWHVDFGIAMSMIAFFHFLWHLKYYLKLFQFKEKTRNNNEITFEENKIPRENPIKIKNIQKLPVLALGISAMITQVVLIREFISVFHGNELVIGTLLANWMILTGLGAFLGRTASKLYDSKRFVFTSMFLSAIIPIATVILLNYLKNIIFPLGAMLGIIDVFTYSFFLLLPFCILSGFLFTYYASSLSLMYNSNLISKVYVLESAGSLGAGILYSFFLIYFFQSLEILSVLSVIIFFIAIFYSRDWKRWYYKLLFSIVVIFLAVSIFALHLDIRVKGFLYPNQKIIYSKDTPYGNLVISESAGQKNFFENNVLLYSTDNVTGNEETVHYPMLQHPSPKKVLLIGGGISGLPDEILKYPVQQIDYVEINPLVIEIGQKITKSLSDSRIKIINEDARLYLRKTSEKFDVIIIDMPAPKSAQINRYFTIEFFRELKEKTTDNAVISFSLPSTENYVSEKASQVQSVIYMTAKQVFNFVAIIPGEKNYFIASDQEPDLNISQLAIQKGIDNVYVNQYYIDDTNLQERSKYILSKLANTELVNKDFRPVAYFMEIGYWMSYFKFNFQIAAAAGIILILLFLLRLNTINFGLFTTGLTSSSMELLFIISFQIIYGYVYQAIGVIITIFMAGLAIGALYQRSLIKKEKNPSFWKIQSGIAVFSISAPGILFLMQTYYIPTAMVYFLFFIMTLIISVFSGFQFSLASQVQGNNFAGVSSLVYSVDLIGSAVGAFLVSVVLFPLLGLAKVFLLLAVLNVISAYFSYRAKNSH